MIATIISWKAVALFRENLCLLLGRSPGRPMLDAITAAARSTPGATGVYDLRAGYIAPGGLHLDMHLEVTRGTPVENADAIATRAADVIHTVVTGAYFVIHVDPANEGHAANSWPLLRGSSSTAGAPAAGPGQAFLAWMRDLR